MVCEDVCGDRWELLSLKSLPKRVYCFLKSLSVVIHVLISVVAYSDYQKDTTAVDRFGWRRDTYDGAFSRSRAASVLGINLTLPGYS
jgi:hypothetical protein